MDVISIQDAVSQAGAQLMSYGPASPEDAQDGYNASQRNIQIAESFGAYEAEYAAIKRHVGIMHLPQRALIELTGNDRQTFLHSLLTQDIKKLQPGDTCRSFLITDKGRLLADVLVHHRQQDTLLETDIFDVSGLIEFLNSRLFAEDVQIKDITNQYTALALHGPAGQPLLNSVLLDEDDITKIARQEGKHHCIQRDGKQAIIYRLDQCGNLGLGLLVSSSDSGLIFSKLLEEAGFNEKVETDNVDTEERRKGLRGRPVGWLAFNTARIEAGTTLFHVDFAGDSLPAETGAIDKAISFTKGCYPGQEIVARMQNLGHPARTLVGIKFEQGKMPVAGGQVFEHIQTQDEKTNYAAARNKTMTQKQVGGITSSTLSPLLGNVPIAIGLVKWGQHEPGTKVDVMCEDEIRTGTVGALKSV